jgi:outer membrane protein assembly factor BamB
MGVRQRLLLLAIMHCLPAVAADWPCYMNDARRSGVSAEKLALPLSPAWTHVAAQAPQPAWPEPGRQMNTLDFDYAFQPVVAGGMLYFGSSADDSMYALDAKTGAPVWRYTAGAPIRFAPHIDQGRCFLAADDGFVYCLQADSGALVWKKELAVNRRMVAGNGRMISRNPCRSGVLVRDGVLYATAGMWPNEGVFVYALDPQTGKELWCNDTCAQMYVKYAHEPSRSFGGAAPHGYLLADDNVLLVACGRAVPSGFDARTGEFLFHKEGLEGFNHNGGHWALIAKGLFFNTAPAWQPDQEVRLGEGREVVGDGIGVYNLGTGRRDWPHGPNYKKLYPAITRIRGDAELFLPGRVRLVCRGNAIFSAGREEVEAIECGENQQVKQLWKAAYPQRVYALILAGNALIVGGPNEVLALNPADGKVIWQSPVDGQARGLALADGRLVVSTHKGVIHSFASGATGGGSVPSRSTAATVAIPPQAAEILKRVPQSGQLKGFALVAGEPDSVLAEALSAATGMHVICVLPEGPAVESERARLLRTTSRYGTGVVVHAAADGARLPHPSYFANLVVASRDSSGIPPAELYRVLRPCGGTMVFLNGGADAVARFRKSAPVPDEEVAPSADPGLLVRGKLPGAFDWDVPINADRRVKWPLELSWFGGPGQQTIRNRHSGAHLSLLAANGRYFAFGQRHLTAVDAYNGTVLWVREIADPRLHDETKSTADNTSIYVPGGDGAVELDAQTGLIKRVFGRPPTPVCIQLDGEKTFQTRKAGKYSGAVTVRRTGAGIELALVTRHPPGDAFVVACSPRDAWELRLDFRPGSQRLSAGGAGAFNAVIFPDYGVWDPGLGPQHNLLSLERKPDNDGSHVIARIAIKDLAVLLGQPPADFDCSARLVMYGRETGSNAHASFSPKLNELPFTGGKDLFRNGTATFVLDPARAEKVAVPVESAGQVADAAKPRHVPFFSRGRATSREDGSELGPWPNREKGYEFIKRLKAFTSEEGDLAYVRTHGCSGIMSSAYTDFFRSGTIGIYDRLDDSGMRNFSATKNGCAISMIAALGLLISSEGTSDCTCNYNFAGSLALAPAADADRSNEDWAMYDDRYARAGATRQAAINFCAPGDRRAKDGTLWLHYPRQPLAQKFTLGIPCRTELFEGGHPFQFNTDRVVIGKTGQPWIHGSGYVGIRRISLDLLYYDPLSSCPLTPTQAAPAVDGALEPAVWGGTGGVDVPIGKSKVGRLYLRSDANALHVGYEENLAAEAPKIAAEAPKPKAAAPASSTPRFDILLMNQKRAAVAHFGVAPGGARQAGRWSYIADVPFAASVTLDGKTGDWGPTACVLGYPKGCGSSQLCWNDKGVFVALQIPADFSLEKSLTGIRFMLASLQKRKLGEVVVNARQRTAEVIEALIKSEPESPAEERDIKEYNRSRKLPENVVLVKEGQNTLIEACLPWEILGGIPSGEDELVYCGAFFDPDDKDKNMVLGGVARRETLLYTGGNNLRLNMRRDSPRRFEASDVLAPRAPYGATHLLRVQEDNTWNPTWKAEARSSGSTLTCEMSLPWETLKAAGVTPDSLVVVANKPRLRTELAEVSRMFRHDGFAAVPVGPVQDARSYTLQLYFTEPMDVAAGERVFDVRVQGRTAIQSLDIAKETGGKHVALVKELKGIQADKLLEIEFVPTSGEGKDRSVPVISGMRVTQE